jgi:DNA transposition AAA+ family ATPase
MTVHDAKAVAQQLGEFNSTSDRIAAEIRRLNRQKIVTLKQVDFLHQWLEGKRQAKQSCRVVGESRTGKTVACNSYRLRHKPIQEVGKPPIVPVVYIQIPHGHLTVAKTLRHPCP